MREFPIFEVFAAEGVVANTSKIGVLPLCLSSYIKKPDFMDIL